jgi:hypothetical protein
VLIDWIPYLIPLWIIANYIINDQIRKGSLMTTKSHYSGTFFTDLHPMKKGCSDRLMHETEKNDERSTHTRARIKRFSTDDARPLGSDE